MHTPGPWTWTDDSERPFEELRGANGAVVCDFGDNAEFLPTIAGRGPVSDDARLIAAAPDLLAALLRIREAFYVKGKPKDVRAALDSTHDLVKVLIGS